MEEAKDQPKDLGGLDKPHIKDIVFGMYNIRSCTIYSKFDVMCNQPFWPTPIRDMKTRSIRIPLKDDEYDGRCTSVLKVGKVLMHFEWRNPVHLCKVPGICTSAPTHPHHVHKELVFINYARKKILVVDGSSLLPADLLFLRRTVIVAVVLYLAIL